MLHLPLPASTPLSPAPFPLPPFHCPDATPSAQRPGGIPSRRDPSPVWTRSITPRRPPSPPPVVPCRTHNASSRFARVAAELLVVRSPSSVDTYPSESQLWRPMATAAAASLPVTHLGTREPESTSRPPLPCSTPVKSQFDTSEKDFFLRNGGRNGRGGRRGGPCSSLRVRGGSAAATETAVTDADPAVAVRHRCASS